MPPTANNRALLPTGTLRPGIVHLGLGAFARAHTAVFTENAMLATGSSDWGIVGVTQRSDTVARQLAPQDGLFTVAERGSGAAPLRVVSSIVEAISGSDHPETVVDRIAAGTTQVVTLTVTTALAASVTGRTSALHWFAPSGCVNEGEGHGGHRAGA